MILVSTADAAHLVDVPGARFSQWAARRGLTPTEYERRGRSRLAWWDPDDVDDAQQRGPIYRTADRGRRAASSGLV